MKKFIMVISLMGMIFSGAAMAGQMLLMGPYYPARNFYLQAQVSPNNGKWAPFNTKTNSNGYFSYPSKYEGYSIRCDDDECIGILTNNHVLHIR